MSKVIIPVVSYSQPDSNNLQKDVVGVFSDRAKAEAAVEDFIEGFLEIERSPYEIQEVNYQEHTIDSNTFELDNSNTSF
jgi:hypothetical protein